MFKSKWQLVLVLTVFTLFLGVSLAYADLYWESEQVTQGVKGQPPGPSIMKSYYTDKASRIELADGKIMIMEYDKKLVYRLDPAAKTYYFVGKDNIPFHAIIWPAQLMGTERLYEDDPAKTLNLPTDVPAAEFLNLEGAQFSKSRAWAVWAPDFMRAYDADPLRYFLTANAPEVRDTAQAFSSNEVPMPMCWVPRRWGFGRPTASGRPSTRRSRSQAKPFKASSHSVPMPSRRHGGSGLCGVTAPTWPARARRKRKAEISSSEPAGVDTSCVSEFRSGEPLLACSPLRLRLT